MTSFESSNTISSTTILIFPDAAVPSAPALASPSAESGSPCPSHAPSPHASASQTTPSNPHERKNAQAQSAAPSPLPQPPRPQERSAARFPKPQIPSPAETSNPSNSTRLLNCVLSVSITRPFKIGIARCIITSPIAANTTTAISKETATHRPHPASLRELPSTLTVVLRSSLSPRFDAKNESSTPGLV